MAGGKDGGNSPRQKIEDVALAAKEKLPKDLQDLVDKDENLLEQIYDGDAGESTDSSLRYAAYARRLRTILVSAQRYVAYTSDIGESFRPVAHPYLVTTAYGISWAYLIGDVGHEGYKAYLRNQRMLHPGQLGEQAKTVDAKATAKQPDKDEKSESATGWLSKLTGTAKKTVAPAPVQQPSDIVSLAPEQVPPLEDWRTVVVKRAMFQSLASMGLPAFTIHSLVKYSGRAMKDVKNVKIRTWGPIGLGLAAVPALPYLFDEPVEEATDWVFHKGFELVGGPEAVRKSNAQKLLDAAKHKASKIHEKEL